MLYLEALGVALYLMHAASAALRARGGGGAPRDPASPRADEVLARHRSFFGVHTVLKDESEGFHVLMHGITVHGAQHLDPARRLEPTTFYHRDGPLGQLFAALGTGGRFRRVALIGLGTGSAACYREPGREWTFFEIDPLVVRARPGPALVHVSSPSALPDAKVVTGDGRLSLQTVPDGSFDLIIVDTFSSDAIPVHMMTREAVMLYFRKLSERGVLMLHITNQYLDLDAGAGEHRRRPGPDGDGARARGSRLPSDGRYCPDGIALDGARARARRPRRAGDPGRMAAPGVGRGGRPWTDDYSNILQALK